MIENIVWLRDVADRFCCFENGNLKGQWSSLEFQSLPSERLQEIPLETPIGRKTGKKQSGKCLKGRSS